MGLTLTCEGCFGKFTAISKDETLPDEEGYVLCLRCTEESEGGIQTRTLQAVVLGIAPWVGVKPPNNSQFTREYNKKWKAFARVLRKIKKDRGL